jgi:tetratricopeptide (TPR) repeat protein
MGIALLKDDHYAESLKIMDDIILKKPDFSEAYYCKGLISFQFSKFEESIELYDKCLSMKKDHFNAHFNKGVSLQSLNRL